MVSITDHMRGRGAILPRPGLFRSLMAFVGFVFLVGTFLLAALLATYNHNDPSWNHAVDASATNLLGPVGAALADILVQSFGAARLVAADHFAGLVGAAPGRTVARTFLAARAADAVDPVRGGAGAGDRAAAATVAAECRLRRLHRQHRAALPRSVRRRGAGVGDGGGGAGGADPALRLGLHVRSCRRRGRGRRTGARDRAAADGESRSIAPTAVRRRDRLAAPPAERARHRARAP